MLAVRIVYEKCTESPRSRAENKSTKTCLADIVKVHLEPRSHAKKKIITHEIKKHEEKEAETKE